MRIQLGTVHVSNYERMLIARHYGMEGMADRDTCRRFIISNGQEELPNLALQDDLSRELEE